ncbi:hypothetical protein BZG36_01011 [Bifiguratus adelaidae]|uniref:Uncharacterized protein n=1 Tax=Bifiguratus adelaidae TaxID=1938954 RepID=A0A261Y6C4_9FUNG|nr:hypothetical protein BZG36_01011 [Bifiguratus adelaidae]
MSQSAPNPLDPSSVLHVVSNVLPSTSDETDKAAAEKGSQLNSPQDALAALCHAIMSSVDFRFVGLGENETVAQVPEASSKATKLPPQWNAHGPESYAFRYKHPQSQLTFLIKCLKMGNRFVVMAMAIEADKTWTLDIPTNDYTSDAFYPYNPNSSSEPLIHGFISTSRLTDFISLFKIKVLQPLIPGLHKEGYEEGGESTTTARTSQPTSSNPPPREGDRDPLSMPSRGRPPFFDDPEGGDEPSGGFPRPYNPMNIGTDDLNPFGTGEPFAIRGPGGSGGPPSGMFVGPNHPIFGPRGGGSGGNGGSGEWGGGIPAGPQRLPRGAVPPGARFDPIQPDIVGGGASRGPNGPFGSRPGRGGGPQGGGRGSGMGPPSGEPDNDDLPPPGYMDMFM